MHDYERQVPFSDLKERLKRRKKLPAKGSPIIHSYFSNDTVTSEASEKPTVQITQDIYEDAEFKKKHDEVRKRLGVKPVSIKIRRQPMKRGSELPSRMQSLNSSACVGGAYDVDSILHLDVQSEQDVIRELAESAEGTGESVQRLVTPV